MQASSPSGMAHMANDIARLRRMIAEPTDAVYSDAALSELLERWPIPDSEGNDTDADDWTATYDYNAAAAEVWGEKAACLSGAFDYSGDGGSMSRSQLFNQARKMSAYYRSRSCPTVTRVRRAPLPYAASDIELDRCKVGNK